MNPRRRALLLGMCSLPGARTALGTPVARHPPVVPGYELRFPEDEGSHPDFRTEWWYVTGWLDTPARPIGFQITFFRTRPVDVDHNPSRFAPHHLLISHAAISDPSIGKLLSDQRAARAGFDLAQARTGRTDVWIDHWRLWHEGSRYRSRVSAKEFELTLEFTARAPVLLHGDRGFSQKGPLPTSASYYYTYPQLGVTGQVRTRQLNAPVRGTGWLDHEWSTALMDEEAVGWDWIGINLDDGGALMAFRMRGRAGPHHWAGGTLRNAGDEARTYGNADVRWRPLRHWRSPRTGTTYPVAFDVDLGPMSLTLEPLMDDQENDARATAGTVYWEGAVIARRAGRKIGRGYLELTGYHRALRL